MAKPKKPMQQYLRYTAVGIELGLSVLVGLFAGKFLDDYFGTAPWLLLTGLIFGCIAGFRSLYRMGRQMMRDLKNEDEAPR